MTRKKEESAIVPRDFSATVKDIKLAILQARARAARLANAEALKLYFFVGGYISRKTRNAKWGSGAIDALSERLQVELPGLRGFSASSLVFMRLFFEAWASCEKIRQLATAGFQHFPSNELTAGQIRYLQSNEIGDPKNRQMPSVEITPMPFGELNEDDIAAFFSIGFTHHREIIRFCKDFDERLYYIHACAKAPWSVEQLRDHLRADDFHHVGALPNNFKKTLSPMALATAAVRSFKDEYLLDLVNLDNVDARYGYETDERVLSKSMVAEIEKTIAALGGADFCFMAREKRHENPTIGLLLCEKMNKPVVQLAVQGYSQPIGIATYQALRNIPDPYKTLAPVIDGVRKVLAEHGGETQKSPRRKSE